MEFKAISQRRCDYRRYDGSYSAVWRFVAKLEGQTIPAVITVYIDRTFTFVTKLPPVAAMIKKALGIDKGGGKAGREVAGKLTKEQVEQIAKEKLGDLNTDNVAAAMKVVEGTARSMGISVE